MTELSVNLDSMRQSAEKMRRAALAMQNSASSVRTVYVTLPPTLQAEIIAEMGLMPNFSADHWLDYLMEFAIKLERAANDIEDAARHEDIIEKDTMPYETTGTVFGDILPRILGTSDDEPFTPVKEKEERFVGGSYISEFNRPVYEALLTGKDDLREAQQRLAYLHLLREDNVSDLEALRSRLIGEGVENVDRIPRVQAMRSDIDRIDHEISTLETNIDGIETHLGELQERLARVAPGRGANFDLIRELENSETMDSIKQNTYGCVNHIVTRMPIPAGIPNDGYLWNDNAAKFAEYGITSGDTPLPGSVIVFEREHSWADSQHGHLMYVERVDNGEVWITDNYNPDEAVRLSDVTSEVSGENVTYLYFPWHTRVI